ncbi:MAG: DUF6778 family protein [Pseudomonadota bacterium]
MKTISSFAVGAAIFALAACEQPGGVAPTAQSEAPAARTASVAPAAAPIAQDPTAIYKVKRVTPTLRADADVGWFAGSEGSPRQVGAFVGASVIEGVETVFTGERPVALEVDIRQFRPAVSQERGVTDAVHRVKLDFIFRDEATGEVIGRADGLFMDLVALVGAASAIARNAGRTPEVRLAERIKQMTGAWSRDASCEVFACPRPTAVAAAPAPTPAPAPAPAAAPAVAPEPAAEPAPRAVEVAPAPAPEAPVPVEVVEVAPQEREAPKGFFEELAASLKGEDEDAAEEQVVEAVDAPAPVEAPVEEPQPTTVVEAPAVEAEEAPKSFLEELAASLRGDENASEPAVEDAEPADVAAAPEAPAETPVETPVEAPSGAVAEAEPQEEERADSLFAVLFGDRADEAREETAAAEPEVAPETAATEPPAPEAPEPEETVIAAAPQAEAEPAPAPAPIPVPAAPTQATTPTTPQEQTPEAGSPFFRSPVSRVPELPQQALLGRSQRQNDPLRRRQGDVVLEVANLPAYWDGDETTGGVWVALPYVPAYRRAVVTNPVNGRTVEANLFWRDPQSGGGSTLLSSQAAQQLGVAPGQVANLGVKIIAAD